MRIQSYSIGTLTVTAPILVAAFLITNRPFAAPAQGVTDPKALGTPMRSSTDGHPTEPSGHYLREWLLCGPFPALTHAEQDIDARKLAAPICRVNPGAFGPRHAC